MPEKKRTGKLEWQMGADARIVGAGVGGEDREGGRGKEQGGWERGVRDLENIK